MKIKEVKSERTPAIASQWTDGRLLRMAPLVLQSTAAMTTKSRARARDDCFARHFLPVQEQGIARNGDHVADLGSVVHGDHAVLLSEG